MLENKTECIQKNDKKLQHSVEIIHWALEAAVERINAAVVPAPIENFCVSTILYLLAL